MNFIVPLCFIGFPDSNQHHPKGPPATLGRDKKAGLFMQREMSKTSSDIS